MSLVLVLTLEELQAAGDGGEQWKRGRKVKGKATGPSADQVLELWQEGGSFELAEIQVWRWDG